MKTLLTLSVLFIAAWFQVETKKIQFSDGNIKSEVEMESGMFNGRYISFYKNEKKSAEGTFENNQRVGLWTAWDSSGQMRMKRDYKNSFQYKIISAKNKRGNIKIAAKDYPLNRNKDGYIEYPKLEEKNVAVSRRLWRDIEPGKANDLLFEENRLFSLLYKNLILKNITAYDNSSDDFKKPLSVPEIESMASKGNAKIIGFKIKEDWFYYSDRQQSEVRIVGICPVSEDRITGKRDMFWLYYPDIQKYLASEKINLTDLKNLKNFDDIFHFRHFASSIYKEDNRDNKLISQYKQGKEIGEESFGIEMDLLEMEHTLWIGSTNAK